MVTPAPVPIDVQDLQFKLHSRLKIFNNEDNNVFNQSYSLLSSASRFGLLFIGSTSPTFQVIQLKSIEKHSLKEGEISNYKRRTISLPSRPFHLSVNCDNTKLVVVVEKYGCVTAILYEVASFLQQKVVICAEIRQSSSPNVQVTEIAWNPTIPTIFTVCKSDGTLGLYELKNSGIEINELPPESQASCMCWSPKGKQIAVGSHNGNITQYKPDLKAVKVVNAPTLEEPYSTIALQWISNYQFIALYKPQGKDSGATLIVVDAPKTGPVIFTNYEDVCYSFGNVRPIQFYTIHQPIWNILMVASSNSMEVGILGSEGDKWSQWILGDSARAELPLSASKQETMPVGITFDTSSVESVLWGEASLPPTPFLFLLSHHGLLCCFRVINIKAGAAAICHPPEVLLEAASDQFMDKDPFAIVPSEAPKQISTPPQPSKPNVIMPQPPAAITSSPGLSQPPQALFKVQPTTAVPKPELPSIMKQTTFPTKPLNQSIPATTIQQSVVNKITSITTAIENPIVSTLSPSTTATSFQEENNLFIVSLLLDECKALEIEIGNVLRNGKSLKINLATDKEATELVCRTDAFEKFLKEVTETTTTQNAEVHGLKQGLIQNWAWYEEIRSRYVQSLDETLAALLRIQDLDPVSQRYSADIDHMLYYINSQLVQAHRVLDEQWAQFQDFCKKIVRMKIPALETIYQTMLRHSITCQRQKYLLQDISNRIRAYRSKTDGPSLFLSINNPGELEKKLQQLKLEPQQYLTAHHQRTVENQRKLTPLKIEKLSKLLKEREVTRIKANKLVLPNTTLESLIQEHESKRSMEASTFLGAALSPISNKFTSPRSNTDYLQSTPKTISSEPKLNLIPQLEPKTPYEPTIINKPSATEVVTEIVSKASEIPKPSVSTATSLFKPTVTEAQSEPLLSKPSPTTPSPLNFNFSNINTSSKIGGVAASAPSLSGFSFSQNQFSFSGTSQPLNLADDAKTTTLAFTPSLPTLTSSAPVQVSTKSQPSTVNSAFVPTTFAGFSFISKTSSSAVNPTPAVSMPQTTKTFNFGPVSTTFETISVPKGTTLTPITTPTKIVPISASTNLPEDPAKLSLKTTSSLKPISETSTEQKTPLSVKHVTFTTPEQTSKEPVTSTSPSATPPQSFPFAKSTSSFFGQNVFAKAISTTSSPATTPVATTTSAKPTDLFQTPIFNQPAVTTVPTSSTAVTLGSIFGGSLSTASPTTTSASLFSNLSTTASGSLFSSPILSTSIFNSPPTQSAPSATTSSLPTTPVVVATTSSTSLFTEASPVSNTLFGAPVITTSSSSPPTTTQESTFLDKSDPNVAASVFRAAVQQLPTENATTTTAPLSMFGAAIASAPSTVNVTTTSVFTPTPSVFETTAPTVFGEAPKTTAPFGGNAFGSPNAFSNPTTTTASSLFGQTSVFSSPSIFGASPVSSTSNSSFGSASFNSNNTVIQPQNTDFNQVSTFSFAAAAANIPPSDSKSLFGFGKPSTFGFPATTTTSSSSFSFGNLNMGGTPTTTTASGFGSSFGQSANANPFAKAAAQEQKPAFGGGSVFGTPSTTSTSIFGGGSPSAFGSGSQNQSFDSPQPGFNQQGFGQSSFANSSFGSPQSGPFSAGNQSVSQTGFGAFGQQKTGAFGGAPVFGGSPSGFGSPPAFGGNPSAFGAAPVFGSPGKVFGDPNTNTSSFGNTTPQQNSTFANLATQSTFGFGSLAQQSPTNQSSLPFSSGSSSFSTWR